MTFSNSVLAFMWAYILVVATYDLGFAKVYEESFATWEINPLARRLYGWGGIESLAWWKVVWLGITIVGLLYAKAKLKWAATGIIFGLHTIVALLYLFSLGQ